MSSAALIVGSEEGGVDVCISITCDRLDAALERAARRLHFDQVAFVLLHRRRERSYTLMVLYAFASRRHEQSYLPTQARNNGKCL